MGLEILLYVPNIIGYIRLILVVLAFCLFQYPFWFIVLYGISISLDGFDGFLARKLNQTSLFGAWFDVVIDLFTRGWLWSALFRHGYLVVFVEWLTFVATHSRGERWKIPDSNFPLLVKLVMAKGFKTPLGIFAVGSLHILPLWLYSYESRFLVEHIGLPVFVPYSGIAFFCVGRTVCFIVELFYIKEYIIHLLTAWEPAPTQEK